MMRRAISRMSSKAFGSNRGIFEVLMSVKPKGDIATAGVEATLLAKHHIYTAECWRRASTARKSDLQAAGLSADVIKSLDRVVGEAFGEAPTRKMLILYGSQTGTAESFAKMMSLMASSHNYVPVLCSMDEGISALTTGETPDLVLFVLSTYGVGEFPRNSMQFVEQLQHNSFLRDTLRKTPYAIFGLGNSHNEQFNAAAKSLDAKLKGLGATSLIRMQLSCEMAAASGHALAFRQWKQAVWGALGGTASGTAASLGAVYNVATCAPSSTEDHILPKSFASAFVRSNRQLTPPTYSEGNAQYQLTMRIPMDAQMDMLGGEKLRSSGRRACITDHIEILPANPDELINRALATMMLDGSLIVEASPLVGAAPSIIDGKKLKVRTLLRDVVDLSCPPPRSFLEAMALAATDATQRQTLEALANDLSPESEYDRKIRSTAWTVVDALEEFTSARMSLAQLLTHAPRIHARKYSIARDNAQWHNDEFEVLYSVPKLPTGHGGSHEGLCTGYLQGKRPSDYINVHIAPSGLATPADEAPLCIIALGTGIGSARALLHHRAMMKQQGKNVGPAVLFYGFRHTGKDQLFVDEFEVMQRDGVVQVTYVPSHDVAGKFVTPMDKLDRSLRDFLGSKGSVMYCGLGGSVPSVVESALRKATIDVGLLRSQGRYIEEYFTPDADTENLLREHGAVLPNTGAATLAARMAGSAMFCMQCEQTFHGKGCVKVGVCGKTPRVAFMQDATVHAAKLLGFYLHEARELKAPDDAALNRLTLFALFTTLTNVNFDESRFIALMAQLHDGITHAKAKYIAAAKAANVAPKSPAAMELPREALASGDKIVEFGRAVGVLTRFTDAATQNGAAVSEMLMYGLKGIAAYTDHSLMNAREDPAIYAYMHKALAFLAGAEASDLGKALALCLEAGSANVTAMGLLYASNSTLGVPKPKAVSMKPVPGKCILVSGHDLIILKALLKVTEPLGINVYTHGEMLPAHSYEQLSVHKNLAGHYGGAWMRQAIEFPHFPGPVLMTTNCLTEPHDSYRNRIYTAGAVGWSGVPHLGDNMSTIRFESVIARAQQEPGFTAADVKFAYPDPIGIIRPESLTVGFGHETVLSVAPTLIDQIKKGNITRFFVVGGCDGFEGQRSYYTELVSKMPKTAVVLTVGCGKFRINHLQHLGTIGDTGIPRILDMGQCNDSFSAVQVALALAKVLDCKVSDLPLSIVLSWFEQKAVAVLLSCLALGLKPIRVGPSLPAFVTPDVLDVLVKDFGVKLCGDPEADLKEMLAAPGAS